MHLLSRSRSGNKEQPLARHFESIMHLQLVTKGRHVDSNVISHVPLSHDFQEHPVRFRSDFAEDHHVSKIVNAFVSLPSVRAAPQSRTNATFRFLKWISRCSKVTELSYRQRTGLFIPNQITPRKVSWQPETASCVRLEQVDLAIACVVHLYLLTRIADFSTTSK
jgi:hypothetical protein